MRIVLDARWLFLNDQPTGVNFWTWNLLKALALRLGAGELTQFFNFTRSHHFSRIEKFKLPGVHTRVVRLPTAVVDRLWLNLGAPAELLLGRHDIFHGVRYFVPKAIRARTVMTIHDLYHVRFPGTLPADWQRYLERRLREMAMRADRITTVSEATTKDVVEMLGVDAEKVVTVGSACDREVFHPLPEEQVQKVVSRYIPTGQPYLLYIGLLTPWKNIERLVAAFEILKETTRCPHHLLLGGKTASSSGPILEAIERSRYRQEIVLTGYLPPEDLPALYCGAEAFVFPSLWEGFGIPLLEAMACSTPVLSSDLASIPDTVGKGGLVVDPYSVDALAEGMQRLVTDDSLRRRLAAAGPAAAARFRWEDVAARTHQVYRELQ